MFIRKYLFIPILTLGFLVQTIETSPGLRAALGLVRATAMPSKHTKPVISVAKKIDRPMAIPISKPTTLQELIAPYKSDIEFFKVRTPALQKHIVEPVRELCTHYVQDPTNRQLLLLRVAEYAATAPGMFLAHSGEYQLAGFIAAESCKHGHWGTIASLSTAFGAAYYYGLNHVKNLWNQKKETIMSPYSIQHNIIGLANRDAI